MMQKLYMITTKDELELPIIVGDNMAEIARRLGKNRETIRSGFFFKWKGYHVVEYEDGELED